MTVTNIEISDEVEDIEPPPPHLTTSFGSVQEWLNHICESEKPSKPIRTYNFALFEGGDNYTLAVSGVNSYHHDADHSTTRVEYQPKDMYYPLQKSEYGNLKPGEVRARLLLVLQEFTRSRKFNESFFKDAQTINAEWKGEIWSRRK